MRYPAMKVLITMMGPSIWGLFNSVWAGIRESNYLPDKVYLLAAESDDSDMGKSMLRILLQEHGSPGDVKIRTIAGDDMKGVLQTVRDIATEEEGNSLALNVTPGRKAVVLGAVFAGWAKETFDHIFYLYIDSLRNASRPYILIPVGVQHNHDIIEEAL
jgi:hypothetical protein